MPRNAARFGVVFTCDVNKLKNSEIASLWYYARKSSWFIKMWWTVQKYIIEICYYLHITVAMDAFKIKCIYIANSVKYTYN